MRKHSKTIAVLGLVIGLTVNNAIFSFAANALPNGSITEQGGKKYLTDSQGVHYSGWFIDSNGDWYYFNESDKILKTGWHYDSTDQFTYYLDINSGKMLTGWQTIDGKEYFFQPIRNMGNYHFNNEQEKWLYSLNSKVPYGALYMNTTTPDGSKVDETGAKIVEKTANIQPGWFSENGRWFYILSDGSRFVNGWKEIDGKSYYFGSDGVMYLNTTTPDGSKVDETGAKIVKKTATIQPGWFSENGRWFYILSDGSRFVNGWKEIDGKSYYFGSDGVMYSNTTTPDGNQVDGSGAKIEKSYQEYIGTFGGRGVEQIPDRPHWPGYFDITSIKGNKIYGTFDQAYNGSYSSDFSQGVPLNGDTFIISVDYNDWGRSGLAQGLENSENFTCTYTVTCKLTYKDGKPIITMNGKLNQDTVSTLTFKVNLQDSDLDFNRRFGEMVKFQIQD